MSELKAYALKVLAFFMGCAILGATIGYVLCSSLDRLVIKHDCRCHEVKPKPGIGEPEPLTEEEFKKLQDELRKLRKPEIGDAP